MADLKAAGTTGRRRKTTGSKQPKSLAPEDEQWARDLVEWWNGEMVPKHGCIPVDTVSTKMVRTMIAARIMTGGQRSPLCDPAALARGLATWTTEFLTKARFGWLYSQKTTGEWNCELLARQGEGVKTEEARLKKGLK